MCTLTYIPTSGGFVFTHNRDEDKYREPALPPDMYEIHGKKLVYPKDGRAGGTWICAGEKYTVCLLNGAFEKHAHLPPYRISRGLVLLDVFQYEEPMEFYREYDLDGVEPFTLVCANNQSGEIMEIRWDGTKKHLRVLPQIPAIWSSCTLYNAEERKKREQIFQEFLNQHPNPGMDAILYFHQTGKTGNPESDLTMQKPNGVMTLSISQIVTAREKEFHYHDRMVNTSTKVDLG